MESLGAMGVRSTQSFSFSQSRIGFNSKSRLSVDFSPLHHLSIGQNRNFNKVKHLQITRASAAIVAAPSSVEQKNGTPNPIVPEKLDEWINESVSEIVKNIGEAPFLVHVYSSPARLELEKEKADGSSWQSIRNRWKQGCPIPDGVMLVEQIDREQSEEEEDGDDGSCTRKWGVVIQGRGVEAASCYILKTCRVWSSLGFCTHFCLLKAKCFGETAELQLQSSWNS